MDKPRKVTKPSQFDAASLFSRVNFLWIIPLFNLGYKRPLTCSDLSDHSIQDDPQVAAEILER